VSEKERVQEKKTESRNGKLKLCMEQLIAGRQKILIRDLSNSLISIYIVNCSTTGLLWKVCQGLLGFGVFFYKKQNIYI